jgi:hypothetical protein
VRQWRANAAMLGFDVWNSLWCDAEFFAHGMIVEVPASCCYSLCSMWRYFCAHTNYLAVNMIVMMRPGERTRSGCA